MDYLADRGYDPAFGARPVKRVVQQELETALAKAILRGEIGEGCSRVGVCCRVAGPQTILRGEPGERVLAKGHPQGGYK